jgi:hypothetical protein
MKRKNVDTSKTLFYTNMMKRAKYNREKRYETIENNTNNFNQEIVGSWLVIDRTTQKRVFGSNDIRDCRRKEMELNGPIPAHLKTT